MTNGAEQICLVFGSALTDDCYWVFVAKRIWLATWLAPAEDADRTPALLHVDADCLLGKGSCLFWLEEHWSLDDSSTVRLVCGSEDWLVLRDSCSPPQRAFIAQEVAPPEGVEVQPLAGNPHVRLSEQPLGVDLAQAEFATRQQSNQWRH